MCGYFCIEFIDFMLKGKSLLDYANLFYPNKVVCYHKLIQFFGVSVLIQFNCSYTETEMDSFNMV